MANSREKMEFTKELLKEIGIEDAIAERLLAAYAADTDKLKAEAEENSGYKERYEAANTELEQIKAEAEYREMRAEKERALGGLLSGSGVPERFFSRVIKGIDLDALTLNKDGTIRNADALAAEIIAEWGDVIPSVTVEGAQVAYIPAGASAPAEPASLTEALRLKYSMKG